MALSKRTKTKGVFCAVRQFIGGKERDILFVKSKKRKERKTVRKIGLQEIEDIALGAALLGAGGGGDPYIGKLVAIGGRNPG